MATRIGETPVVPQRYTISLYKGITYSRAFEYNNPDGTPINLTAKYISIHFKDIFPTELVLLSNGPSSTLGSFIHITDAVAGKFYLQISADETESTVGDKGKWWMELHEGDNITLLWLDVAKVVEL